LKEFIYVSEYYLISFRRKEESRKNEKTNDGGCWRRRVSLWWREVFWNLVGPHQNTRERTRPCEAARGKPNFTRGVHRRTIVSRTICWLTLGFTMGHDAIDPIPWQERTTVGIRGLLGHVYATQAVHKSGWRQPLTDTCVGRSTPTWAWPTGP